VAEQELEINTEKANVFERRYNDAEIRLGKTIGNLES